jgi:signal transduction histidine kinase
VRALRSNALSDALRARAVDALAACIELQAKMIDDLIDVAQAHRGELWLERERLDLRTVVQSAVEAITPSVSAKQINLTVETPAEPLWVMGDATRLGQVLANLLSNAVAFTGEAGRIEVSVGLRSGEAVLVLRDDGEGIEGPRLDGIFEPPARASEPTASRHSVGLGLGLTIAYQLVTQHGGKISAESAGAGRGSCFTITLPLPPS